MLTLRAERSRSAGFGKKLSPLIRRVIGAKRGRRWKLFCRAIRTTAPRGRWQDCATFIWGRPPTKPGMGSCVSPPNSFIYEGGGEHAEPHADQGAGYIAVWPRDSLRTWDQQRSVVERVVRRCWCASGW